MGHPQIEICANGLQSALIAQQGGADRIELCRSLELDGLTPNPRTIRSTVRQLDIPVHLLVRPRSGNFRYTKKEIETMLQQIALAREIGCAGIVSGALNAQNEVDLDITSKLIEASGNLNFTFHRAFDVVSNQKSALEQLIKLGVDRVLTSAGERTALDGMEKLCDLFALASGQIEIMPGGGINSENTIHFLENGFTSVHLSASRISGQAKVSPPRTRLNEVRAVVQAVRSFSSIQNKG